MRVGDLVYHKTRRTIGIVEHAGYRKVRIYFLLDATIEWFYKDYLELI